MAAKGVQTPVVYAEEFSNSITSNNIKLALFYRFKDRAKLNPLENLALVDKVISDPAFPLSSHGRKFALMDILTSLVFDELKRHRQLMEIPSSPPESSISEIYQAISQDAQTHNSELIGWSWLYYRYVRIDFSIAQHVFAQITCLDDRTIRRYQDRTLTCLIEILIEKEWKARRQRITMQLNNLYTRPKRLKRWGTH